LKHDNFTTIRIPIPVLWFADDIVIAGRSIGALNETMKKLMNATQIMELSQNEKTKINESSKKQQQILKILKIDEWEYERVGEFKMLGIVLTEDNIITADIKFRIIMTNETSYGFKEKLNLPNLKRQTQYVMYA
jgi:hypothetical protein